MLRIALTTGLASLFVIGLTTLTGCPPSAGTGEGEGEGAAGEGEGAAGEGEGVAGEGEGEGAGEGEGEGAGEGEGEGAPPDEFCLQSCTTNEDCDLDIGTGGAPEYFNFICNSSSRCVVNPCAADADCNARQAGIGNDCTANSDCGTGAHCIDVGEGGGAGKCDFATSEATAGNCLDTTATQKTVKDVGGNNVVICISGAVNTCNTTSNLCEAPAPAACTTDANCTGGTHCDTTTGDCVQCNLDADCTGTNANPNTPKCYTTTHTCGCTLDTQCGTAGTAPSKCNTTTGGCICQASSECTGSLTGDVCNADGSCGCADASTDCGGATSSFDNTTTVCAAH